MLPLYHIVQANMMPFSGMNKNTITLTVSTSGLKSSRISFVNYFCTCLCFLVYPHYSWSCLLQISLLVIFLYTELLAALSYQHRCIKTYLLFCSVEQWGMEPRLLMMLGKGNSSSWTNVLPPQARQLYILLFAMAWQT